MKPLTAKRKQLVKIVIKWHLLSHIEVKSRFVKMYNCKNNKACNVVIEAHSICDNTSILFFI